MKLQSKYADLVLNLLVAVAISLVVNFSYVLLMLVDLNSDSQPRPSDQRAVERPDEGVLSVHPDGYGYLVYENGDSVYVPTRRMRWLEIAPGDRIVADLMPPRSEKAHPMLAEIRTRNGAESSGQRPHPLGVHHRGQRAGALERAAGTQLGLCGRPGQKGQGGDCGAARGDHPPHGPRLYAVRLLVRRAGRVTGFRAARQDAAGNRVRRPVPLRILPGRDPSRRRRRLRPPEAKSGNF